MNTAILVQALADKYGSINAASRQADIPVTTLFKLKREPVDVRLSTLAAVARGLERSLTEVVAMLGDP
ncbi:MAG: hypothetical protein M3O21_02580 [Chloroflexota bacterium]|nr:hypothetical protein [Chloroflexota bacterium]